MPPSPADRPPRRPRRTSPSVSIVIPVRDAAGLPPMLRTLPAADEVIVVTAGPGPDAAVLAACPGALLVRQTRTGLGNALACGFATATGDVLVTLDGDGATDPAELPRYVDALLAGADVAFGSRYRDGGRDLTAGRFRRGLNLVLAWLLNVLYGAHRTDPGFGYAAFRRDALDRLTLPDPAPASPPVWGDGPEIEALLAVRAAARGLTVAEVPGVAYPRMRRSSHADRATVRHWLRVLLTEFRGRTTHPPRHSAAASTPQAGLSTGAPHDLHFSARIEIGGGPRRVLKGQAAKDHAAADQAAADQAAADQAAADQAAADQAAADQAAADQAAARHHVNPVEPIWGPARRTPDPVHLGLADIPAPLDRPVPPTPDKSLPPGGLGVHEPAIASVPAPRTGDIGRVTGRRGDDPDPEPSSDTGEQAAAERRRETQTAEQRREVGTRRRHLEGYRQRPDLRVINGEGSGDGRSRSGRLRAVPPREITGGRPGPQ
jgi:hypothetical protein